MKSAKQILQHFGYTDEWMRLGVVTPSSLQEQHDEFHAADDKNKEHYRCGAFRSFLSRLDSVPDELLDDLLLLTDSGSDGCDLSLDRAFALVRSDLLSDEQLRRLAKHPKHSVRQSLIIAIERVLIRRRLAAGGLTGRIFRDACELNDPTTLEYILNRDDVRRDHVAWVAQHGCNKRLRNIATQMLQSCRFQDGR